MAGQGEITIRAWQVRDREAVEGKEAGHSLYRSLGFEERDTRSFRLLL